MFIQAEEFQFMKVDHECLFRTVACVCHAENDCTTNGKFSEFGEVL